MFLNGSSKVSKRDWVCSGGISSGEGKEVIPGSGVCVAGGVYMDGMGVSVPGVAVPRVAVPGEGVGGGGGGGGV